MNIFHLSESIRALLAVALAVIPALIAYVRGRQIARFADDPALPERLFAGRQVTGRFFGFALSALFMLTGGAAIWGIPLAVLAYFAAGLPLRRILYNETWSLPVYLSFVIRLFVGFWTFWILLCALPALTLQTGERGWLVALALGAGLMVLASGQTAAILWLLGARPLVDHPIRARLDRLVAASGLAAPRFAVVDLRGGNVANAFALASLRQSAVVFTRPLLDRLDADETDAICAHELAHLEYYNARRLRQRRLVSRSLVAGAALLTPTLMRLVPSIAWFACALWPVVVLMVLGFLARDRQKHETASDLRAVALTGNPEALVRALIKLHALARVPRRWDADLERQMTHPSLKRRIQDIRAAAGTPPAALGEAAVFDSAGGAARVVFRDDSLEWIEGASASYRLRYDCFSELRIAAARTGATSLVAADRAGHRWQMPLRTEDVPRIQTVLDIVDARVETRAPAGGWLQPVVVRALVLVAFIISIDAGMFAGAIVFAITLARPAAPLVGASGLAAIAGALLVWRDRTYLPLPGEFEFVFAAVLLVTGALLAGFAYAQRRDDVPARVWKLTGVLALAAVASWLVPLVASRVDVISLHQTARQWPSSVMLPLGLAGALVWSSRTSLRLVAAGAIAASLTAAVAGSERFLDRFGGDPFLVAAKALTVRTLEHPVKEFTVPFGVSQLHISPSARSIAAVSRDPENHFTLHIGRAGEALTPLDVDGALFIDDDRVLVWTVDGTTTDLREVSVAAPDSASWQVRVTGLTNPAVSLDRDSKRWRLISPGLDVVDVRDGVLGTADIAAHQWRLPEGRTAALMPIALSGGRALAIEPGTDLETPAGDPLGALAFLLANAPRSQSTIWSLGPDGAADLGTSRLELECRPLALADRGVCQIFDASRTRFFFMDAARGITPIASLPGRFFTREEPQGGWLTGWYQSGAVAVRLASADAIRVAGPDGARPHALAASDHMAAGVWYQVPASGMRVTPLYAGTGTSVIRIYSID